MDVAASLPVVSLIVDTAERIAALLPPLEEMIAPGGGLITVADVAAQRYHRPGSAAGRSEHLKVRQIMETRVQTVPPEMPVAGILPLRLNRYYKALPVVDGQGRLLGILGRLDLLKAAGHMRPAPGHPASGPHPVGVRTLGDVMLSDVPAVGADTPLAAVADTLVGSQGTRRVVVVDGPAARRVVGIISQADLVGQVAGPDQPGLWQALRESLGLRSASGADLAARLHGPSARDVMTSPAVTAPATLPIVDGIRLMIESGVKVLPVVDADGQLVSLVNRARLLQAVLG